MRKNVRKNSEEVRSYRIGKPYSSRGAVDARFILGRM